MEHITEKNNVLLLWKDSALLKNLEVLYESVKKRTKNIKVENVDRLFQSNYPNSSFDVILSGVVQSDIILHDSKLLCELVRLVTPSGKVILHQNINDTLYKSKEELISSIKTSGFILTNESIKDNVDTNILTVVCEKPNFEVGSSVKLSFKNKPNAAAVWKIDDTVDDDLINQDDLLDEEDLKKPDASSLKVCATTGKRKACKDCSCGLAEELDAENDSGKPKEVSKSSCGSCYLGDAFRCSTCPYLGMPAFKPGDKIQLPENHLKADI